MYDFSIPYYTSTNKVIINKEDLAQYTSLDSLAEANIGAQKGSGSIQEQIIKEQLPSSTVIALASNGELINQLKSQKVISDCPDWTLFKTLSKLIAENSTSTPNS
ncbi:type 2 periplasmic-binding domain-containing protein [Streptococcus suis]|uniref:transporter substrate-binding domain-containing protein n=1 Tax=Streptococcus suis TaxID=1307 RepID=UPI0021BBFE37|nr:transporter substrate-binding domain-containing protein [Streptococcus suis]